MFDIILFTLHWWRTQPICRCKYICASDSNLFGRCWQGNTNISHSHVKHINQSTRQLIRSADNRQQSTNNNNNKMYTKRGGFIAGVKTWTAISCSPYTIFDWCLIRSWLYSLWGYFVASFVQKASRCWHVNGFSDIDTIVSRCTYTHTHTPHAKVTMQQCDTHTNVCESSK